jgi:hypothetical protein
MEEKGRQPTGKASDSVEVTRVRSSLFPGQTRTVNKAKWDELVNSKTPYNTKYLNLNTQDNDKYYLKYKKYKEKYLNKNA